MNKYEETRYSEKDFIVNIKIFDFSLNHYQSIYIYNIVSSKLYLILFFFFLFFFGMKQKKWKFLTIYFC